MKWIEVEEDDLETLFGVLKYVVLKEGEVIDKPMVEFIQSEVDRVQGHLRNEAEGAGIAVEITQILGLIPGDGRGRR